MISKFAKTIFTKLRVSTRHLLPSSDAGSNSALHQALLITIIYFVLGCAWIIITDVLTSATFAQTSPVSDINIIKGLLFVIISAALIFILVYPTLKKLVALRMSLQISNSTLEKSIVNLRFESQKSSAVEKTLIKTQQHAHIGSFDFEISSGLLMCSDEALKICGIKRKDFFETLSEICEHIYPEDRQTALNLCKRAMIENHTAEYDCRVINSEVEGQVICARLSPIYDENNKCIRILGTVHDITERRKTELSVIKERNRAQMYLDVAGVIFIGINEKAIVTLINNAGCKLLCYPKEEIIGKVWIDNFVIGACKAKFLSAQEKLRNGNAGDTMDYENCVLTGCGEERLISWRLVAIRDEQGNYAGIIGSGIDITEQQAALHALRESERSKAVLLSHLPGMAYRCCFDHEWTMKFLSEGCYKLTGYWPESIINNLDLSYNDIICPEYRDYIWSEMSHFLNAKEPYKFKYEITTATGERKWVWEFGQGVFSDNGNLEALEGIVLDITESTQHAQSNSEEQA